MCDMGWAQGTKGLGWLRARGTSRALGKRAGSAMQQQKQPPLRRRRCQRCALALRIPLMGPA